ncbi:MAG: PAS domain S-box protein, partial [Chloroflexi bacterium]|nr:PAS domain S-box protein [Chloroflexota bacterium]
VARQGAIEADTERVLTLISEQACRLLGAGYAVLSLVSPDGAVARRGMYGARTDAWVASPGPRPLGLTGRVLTTGRTVLVERLPDNLDAPPDEFFMHLAEGARTALGTPLFRGRDVIGALVLGWRADVTLRSAQTRLAEALAAYAATIVENARARAGERSLAQQSADTAAELAAVIEQMPSGVFAVDAAGNMTLTNEAARRILGLRSGLGANIYRLAAQRGPRITSPGSDDALPVDEQPMAQALRGEFVHDREVLLHRPDRPAPVVLQISATPLRGGDGEITGAVGVFTDVTQERRLLQDLATSEEQLRTLYQTISCGVVVLDPDGRVLHANEAALLIYGLTLEQMQSGPPQWRRTDEHGVSVPLAERPAVIAARDRTPIHGAVMGVERPDGGWRWVQLDATPLVDEDGQVTQVVTSFIDITERRRAEETLRLREASFRLLTEHATDIIARHAPDGLFLYASPACTRLLGYLPEELVGRSLFDLVHPDEAPAVRASFAAAMALPMTDAVGYRIRTSDGHYAWIETTLSALRDGPDGAVSEVHGSSRDISERRLAEASMRESEERFRKVFEDGPIGMAIVGADYRFAKVNTALCAMLGYTEQELTALTFPDITHSDDIETDLALAAKLARGEIPTYHLEKRYIRKDGECVWINLTVSVVKCLGPQRGRSGVATEQRAIAEQGQRTRTADAGDHAAERDGRAVASEHNR